MLHFSPRRFFSGVRQRVFNINIEGNAFNDVDIVKIAGAQTALTLQVAQAVDDGAVSISLTNSVPQIDNPKISGIEIKLLSVHLAHAVANGPYTAVDVNNAGSVVISVDGSASHTHAPGLFLNQWIWKEGAQVLGTGQQTSFNLPVGLHNVALTVVDNGGNTNTILTTISILPFGYPAVTGLSPTSGSIAGNTQVTITGSGFTYPANQTVVRFGLQNITGDAIQIVNSSTIKVQSPLTPIGYPAPVTVTTPLGTSNAATFTYVAGSPIVFVSANLTNFVAPTVATFGPDGKLYVGTINGQVGKLTLNNDFTAVTQQVISTVATGRGILGIVFNPMDAGAANPPVYISSSLLFHGETKSSSGLAINGKVHKVSGANLDIVVDIITGLPVNDGDHGEQKLSQMF
jgi:IPT/TIG domain/Malectin domain